MGKLTEIKKNMNSDPHKNSTLVTRTNDKNLKKRLLFRTMKDHNKKQLVLFPKMPDSEIEEVSLSDEDAKYMVKLKFSPYTKIKKISKNQFSDYENGENILKYFQNLFFRREFNPIFSTQQRILTTHGKGYLIQWSSLSPKFATWESSAPEKCIENYQLMNHVFDPLENSNDINFAKLPFTKFVEDNFLDFFFNTRQRNAINKIVKCYLEGSKHISLIGDVGSVMRKQVLYAIKYIKSFTFCNKPVMFVVDEPMVSLAAAELDIILGKSCLQIRFDKDEINFLHEENHICHVVGNQYILAYPYIIISHLALPFMMDLFVQIDFLLICADATSSKIAQNLINNLSSDFLDDEEIQKPTNEEAKVEMFEDYLNISKFQSLYTISLLPTCLAKPDGNINIYSYSSPRLNVKEEFIFCQMTPPQRYLYDDLIFRNFKNNNSKEQNQTLFDTLNMVLDHPDFINDQYSPTSAIENGIKGFSERSGKLKITRQFIEKAFFNNKRLLIITENRELHNLLLQYFKSIKKPIGIHVNQNEELLHDFQYVLYYVDEDQELNFASYNFDYILCLSPFVDPIRQCIDWPNSASLPKECIIFRLITDKSIELLYTVEKLSSDISDSPEIIEYMKGTYARPISELISLEEMSIKQEKFLLKNYKEKVPELIKNIAMCENSDNLDIDESDFSEDWNFDVIQSVFKILYTVCWGNWKAMEEKMPINISQGSIKEVAYIFLGHLLSLLDLDNPTTLYSKWIIAQSMYHSFKSQLKPSTQDLLQNLISDFTAHTSLLKHKNKIETILKRIQDLMIISAVKLTEKNGKIFIPKCNEFLPNRSWNVHDDMNLIDSIYWNGYNSYSAELMDCPPAQLSNRFHALVSTYMQNFSKIISKIYAKTADRYKHINTETQQIEPQNDNDPNSSLKNSDEVYKKILDKNQTKPTMKPHDIPNSKSSEKDEELVGRLTESQISTFAQLLINYGSSLTPKDIRNLLDFNELTDDEINILKNKFIDYAKGGKSFNKLTSISRESLLSSIEFFDKLSKFDKTHIYEEDRVIIEAISFWGLNGYPLSPILKYFVQQKVLNESTIQNEIDKLVKRKVKREDKIFNKIGEYELNTPVIVADKITLLSIGFINPRFHNENYIYPIDYAAISEWNGIEVLCEIKNGRHSPLFKLSYNSGVNHSFTDNTPDGVWKKFLLSIENTRKLKYDLWRPPGHEMFGLTSPISKMIIQAQPGANDCKKYKPKYFRTNINNLQYNKSASQILELMHGNQNSSIFMRDITKSTIHDESETVKSSLKVLPQNEITADKQIDNTKFSNIKAFPESEKSSEMNESLEPPPKKKLGVLNMQRLKNFHSKHNSLTLNICQEIRNNMADKHNYLTFSTKLFNKRANRNIKDEFKKYCSKNINLNDFGYQDNNKAFTTTTTESE